MQEDKTTPLLPSTLQLHLSQKDTSKGVHRFDLQGLRGVAILSVLGFHFFSKWFPNGYVGVDQFFVLSGYLMAMILDAGSGFSHICDFYYRRLKRIIPMYILIILFILWSCLFIFPQSYLDLNGKSVIPALIFLSNLWRTAGGVVQYFAELNVAENLVVHTWSLAVEMQFYLVVPILHVFLREYSTRSQITCLLIVGHLAYLSASTHRKYALVKTEENTDEREHEEQQYFTGEICRETFEALWIAVRNPTINRKEERVEVTQELAAFADLCGLDPKDSRPEAR
ncbi:unnamed protein product [Nippostrongylus brasiliensis]|uniref:Acyl_transf_3 domain-containing protein n=1 Tax=Nippostrongylus brasiliensis TaxID=27835 RepID=A0A0N4XZN1_NIPBR|nr:unnamed protein product [Nippostrongylus brasiliensis]